MCVASTNEEKPKRFRTGRGCINNSNKNNTIVNNTDKQKENQSYIYHSLMTWKDSSEHSI